MLVTKTPIWIRLIDLPLHFQSTQSLEVIGNTTWKFLKIDIDRAKLGLATFARICVEVDMSKGLPEKIILKWKNYKWMVQLDYQNTTFHCCTYQQTSHLQDSFPLTRTTTPKKKGNKPRNKRWNSLVNSQPGDLDQEEDLASQSSKSNKEEDLGLEQMNEHSNKQVDPSIPKDQHYSRTPIGPITSGNKRAPESSDSNKEKPLNASNGAMREELKIVLAKSNNGVWVKVINKRGRSENVGHRRLFDSSSF